MVVGVAEITTTITTTMDASRVDQFKICTHIAIRETLHEIISKLNYRLWIEIFKYILHLSLFNDLGSNIFNWKYK